MFLPGRGLDHCALLWLQLARHNKELQSMLKPGGQVDGDEALEFYAKHTAQIEVRAEPVLHTGLCKTSRAWHPVPGCMLCLPSVVSNHSMPHSRRWLGRHTLSRSSQGRPGTDPAGPGTDGRPQERGRHGAWQWAAAQVLPQEGTVVRAAEHPGRGVSSLGEGWGRSRRSPRRRRALGAQRGGQPGACAGQPPFSCPPPHE